MATTEVQGAPATNGGGASSVDPTRSANDAVSIRPAVDADIDDLGEIFAEAFALIMKNVFPSGCNSELIALRRHTLRKLHKAANEPGSSSHIDVAVSLTPEGKEQRLGFIMWRYVGLNGYEEPHPRDDEAVFPKDGDAEMQWRFMDALRKTAQKVASHEEHIRGYHRSQCTAYSALLTDGPLLPSDIDICCVNSKVARTGAGKRLFAHVHYHALKARRAIYLDAAPTGSALPFWKSKGFAELARSSSYGLDDAIAMWRRLKKSEHYKGEFSEDWARELTAKPAFEKED